MLHGLTVQLSLFPLELGNDLIDLVRDLFFVLQYLETIQQLSKGSRRVGYHRFHGIDGIQRFIDTDRIINLKVSLMDLGAQTGGTAQHLFKQNAGFYPAQEHQIGDLRHIDTGSQQVHSDSNTWIALILESLDGLLYLFGIAAAHAAGDLHNRVIVHAVFCIDILEDVHNHVGMLVIHSIYEGFALFLRIFWVDVLSNFGQHCLVEGTGDDFLIKLLHIEVELIVQ